jgi:hypothetical protein
VIVCRLQKINIRLFTKLIVRTHSVTRFELALEDAHESSSATHIIAIVLTPNSIGKDGDPALGNVDRDGRNRGNDEHNHWLKEMETCASLPSRPRFERN